MPVLLQSVPIRKQMSVNQDPNTAYAKSGLRTHQDIQWIGTSKQKCARASLTACQSFTSSSQQLETRTCARGWHGNKKTRSEHHAAQGSHRRSSQWHIQWPHMLACSQA